MSEESSVLSKFDFLRSLPNVITLALVVAGSFVLAWVIQLTWIDVSVWNKDIGTILLGSRTGESISLGIGMTVMYYLLIGVALIAAGSVVFIKEHVLTAEPKQKVPKMPKAPNKIKAQKVKSAPLKTTNVESKPKTEKNLTLPQFKKNDSSLDAFTTSVTCQADQKIRRFRKNVYFARDWATAW